MSFFRQLVFLFAVIFAGAGITALIVPKPPRVAGDEITVADAQNAKNVLWVDARSEAEFAAGHIAGALNLNENNRSAQIAFVLEKWQPGQTVIVYCGSAACASSRAEADRLRGPEYGLGDVRVLRGGWDAWQRATGATEGTRNERR